MTALESRFAGLESRFDGLELRMTALLEKRHTELLKWAFVFWCGSVFAIAGLVIAALK